MGFYRKFYYKNQQKKNIRDDSPQYTKWRQEVVKRDKNKCQMPKCRRRCKEVHHILKYADSPSLRYEVKNGICLCWQHHKEVTQKEYLYVSLFTDIVSRK
jgi:hypothetical protein